MSISDDFFKQIKGDEENFEIEMLEIFLNVMKNFIERIGTGIKNEKFNESDFSKSLFSLSKLYKTFEFTNTTFYNIYFLARDELRTNINRLTDANKQEKSIDVKYNLKTIVNINILRFYELLSVRLFDKKIEIISEYVKFQCCEKTKYYLIKMKDSLVIDRDIFCHKINEKRYGEQKIMENSIIKSSQLEFNNVSENIVQEDTSKKRKECETTIVSENHSFIGSFHKRITFNVLKERINSRTL